MSKTQKAKELWYAHCREKQAHFRVGLPTENLVHSLPRVIEAIIDALPEEQKSVLNEGICAHGNRIDVLPPCPLCMKLFQSQYRGEVGPEPKDAPGDAAMREELIAKIRAMKPADLQRAHMNWGAELNVYTCDGTTWGRVDETQPASAQVLVPREIWINKNFGMWTEVGGPHDEDYEAYGWKKILAWPLIEPPTTVILGQRSDPPR